MPKVSLEADEADLYHNGLTALERRSYEEAVDRFLRAGRARDRRERAERAALVPEDAREQDRDFRAGRRKERLEVAARAHREDVVIALAWFPGFSRQVPVIRRWTEEYREQAELVFISACAESIDENGCWLWTAAVNGKGLPVLSIGGPANLPAREFAYRLWNGELKRGFQLVQTCGVELCVSLDHCEVVPRVKAYDGSEGVSIGDVEQVRR